MLQSYGHTGGQKYIGKRASIHFYYEIRNQPKVTQISQRETPLYKHNQITMANQELNLLKERYIFTPNKTELQQYPSEIMIKNLKIKNQIKGIPEFTHCKSEKLEKANKTYTFTKNKFIEKNRNKSFRTQSDNYAYNIFSSLDEGCNNKCESGCFAKNECIPERRSKDSWRLD